MGCCQGTERTAKGTNNELTALIIDVEETLANAAWNAYYHSKTGWGKCRLKRKNYTVEVPMNYFQFQVIDPHFDPIPQDKSRAKKDDKKAAEPTADKKSPRRGGGAGQGNIQVVPVAASSGEPGRDHTVGLDAEFINDTSQTQTYNFRCEKTRESTMTVNFQKGFTIGGKTNFTLGIPKVLANGKVGGEIDMRVTVTKTKGESFKTTLTTCATSDIKVAKNSRYTATVNLEERSVLLKFEVKVRMSMPAGEAHIFIKDKRGKTVYIHPERTLSELFPKSTHVYSDDEDDDDDSIEEGEEVADDEDEEKAKKDEEEDKGDLADQNGITVELGAPAEDEKKDEEDKDEEKDKKDEEEDKGDLADQNGITVELGAPAEDEKKDEEDKDKKKDEKDKDKKKDKKDKDKKKDEKDKDKKKGRKDKGEKKDTDTNMRVIEVREEEEEMRIARPDAVQFVIEGQVDGVQMSSHRIHLVGKKISGAEQSDQESE